MNKKSIKWISLILSIILLSFTFASCNLGNNKIVKVYYDNIGSSSGKTPVDLIEYTLGDSITVKGNDFDLKKTDYEFNGWSYSSSGHDNEVCSCGDVIKAGVSDIHFHPIWIDSPKYTVTFESNLGTFIAPVEVIKGHSITIPEEPTRSDYIFTNWYYDSGTNNIYNFADALDGPVTIYAGWDALPRYTVTFDSKSGSEVSPIEVIQGHKVPRPYDPIREDFTFTNWYSDSEATQLYNFDDALDGPVTIYAGWDALPRYTITFNSKSGSAVSSIEVIQGHKVPRPYDPIREDFTFTNWYSDSEATQLYNFDDALDGPVIIYAGWDALPRYTITFNSKSGSAVSSIEVIQGHKVPRPYDPIREDFTFTNWYYDFATTHIYDFANAVYGPVTIYAGWDALPRYTVTFDSKSGSEVSPIEVIQGHKVPLPEDPTRTDYKFTNWCSDSEATQPYNFANAVYGPVTIYAGWDALPRYTVTFNSKSGSEVSSIEVIQGHTITLPEEPTRTDYKFTNWCSDSEATQPYNFANAVYGPVTIYAGWNKIFTVSFVSNCDLTVEPISVIENQKCTNPTEPTKAGYNFSGWFLDSEFTTPWTFATALVTAPITLYAQWINSYLSFSLLDNDTYEVSSYESDLEEITIPSYYKGKPITSVRSGAFANQATLKKVILPDTITFIKSQAFYNCTSLYSINISDTMVKSIGSHAFYRTALTSLTFPDSLIIIEGNAFSYNRSLKILKLNDSIVQIGSYAFINSGITKLVIPDSVESIDSYAFAFIVDEDCTLTSIELGSNLKTIGPNAFYNANITKLVIPDSVVTIENNAFHGSPITDLTLNSGLKTIEGMAFYDSCITSVRIPQSVNVLGYNAFSSNNLTNIYCEVGEKPDDWDDSWYYSQVSPNIYWGYTD
jgi:uncharacterized repeat protein (TIGR02543 family)